MVLLSRLFSQPLHSRYLVRKAASWVLPDHYYAKFAFRQNHGRFPSNPPVTFNERISGLIASGRLDQVAPLADKLAVRDYVAQKVGPYYLVPLHARADRLTRDLWDRLPDSFMLKPNHGSGWSHLVQNKEEEDFDAVAARSDNWLAKNYYYFYREMQYRWIAPALMFEEVVTEGSGIFNPETSDSHGELVDYKILCFHGRPLLIFAILWGPPRQRLFYDFDWNKLNVSQKLSNESDLPRPAGLDEMYRVAETLSKGFDFVRVDLFSVPRGIYFGELTFTPLAGSDPIDPPEFDAFLGNLWGDPKAARTATFERWHECQSPGLGRP